MSVIVVGDGIAGSTVALALRRRGSPVTLIGGCEHPGAATPAAAGMIAPQYESAPSEPTFQLGLESRRRYPDFLDRLLEIAPGDVGLVAGGMLVANLDAAERERAIGAARAHRREGLEATVLDGEAGCQIEPAASPEVDSFLWLPCEARLDARRLAETLHRGVEAAEVRFEVGPAVTVVRDGDSVAGVRLGAGDLVRGSAVVIAAGAWSADIDGLPHRLPVRPVRGQMLRLASEALPVGPVLADHAGRYLVPAGDGALAGSTMEEAGFTVEVTESGVAAIRRAVRRLCPAADRSAVAESWSGLRPVSDDGAPIVGPEPELAGLFYATGYGRSGVLLAPLMAEAVADLALGREPDIAWRPLSIERFRGA
jgi:glycine oxidase